MLVLEVTAGPAEVDQQLATVLRATPVTRETERRLIPSTRADTTAMRSALLSTFAILSSARALT